jgi:hypothetical protein
MATLKAAMKMEQKTMEKKLKEAETKAKENFDKESRERGAAFEQERKELKEALDKERVERKTSDEEVQEALKKAKKELEREREERLQFEASTSELSSALQHAVLNQVCDCSIFLSTQLNVLCTLTRTSHRSARSTSVPPSIRHSRSLSDLFRAYFHLLTHALI